MIINGYDCPRYVYPNGQVVISPACDEDIKKVDDYYICTVCFDKWHESKD
jgi:hypothetical protein